MIIQGDICFIFQFGARLGKAAFEQNRFGGFFVWDDLKLMTQLILVGVVVHVEGKTIRSGNGKM